MPSPVPIPEDPSKGIGPKKIALQPDSAPVTVVYVVAGNGKVPSGDKPTTGDKGIASGCKVLGKSPNGDTILLVPGPRVGPVAGDQDYDQIQEFKLPVPEVQNGSPNCTFRVLKVVPLGLAGTCNY